MSTRLKVEFELRDRPLVLCSTRFVPSDQGKELARPWQERSHWYWRRGVVSTMKRFEDRCERCRAGRRDLERPRRGVRVCRDGDWGAGAWSHRDHRSSFGSEGTVSSSICLAQDDSLSAYRTLPALTEVAR